MNKEKISYVDQDIKEITESEKIEQERFPELNIDHEHRRAFNFVTDIIERREGIVTHGENKGEKIRLKTKFCVSDRALGKTINGNITLLYKVSIDDNYSAALLSRNWNENASQVRPYYEDLLRKYVWEYWKGDQEEGALDDKWRQKWFLQWRPLYRGIVYDGQERIKFVDLYNPSNAKKRVAEPLSDLIFDEFIPSRDQREEGKGYQPNELKRYSDVEKSCRRKNKMINKVFFGNPNDPYWNIPYLADFYDILEEEEKWYWKECPEDLEEYRKWEWEKTYTNSKGQQLVLRKMEGEEPEFPSYEDFNWHVFYARREDLGIRKWTNGWQPIHIFLGQAVFYDRTCNEYIFVDIDWLKRNKPRHWHEFDRLPEQTPDDWTFVKSSKAVQFRIRPIKGKEDAYRREIIDNMAYGKIKFLELESKTKIENYAATGRTRPKKGEQKPDWEGGN